MKIVMVVICFACYSFPQGNYLSGKSGFLAGIQYGWYDETNNLGFTAAYSLRGLVDLSYTRSSFLNKDIINNSLNEYFLRFYLLKNNRIFFSGSAGYIYHQSQTELWQNYKIQIISKGMAYEAAIHLVAPSDTASRKFVASICYRYFNASEETRISSARISDTRLTQSFIFDFAIVYNLSFASLIINPRIGMNDDRPVVYFSLNLGILLSH